MNTIFFLFIAVTQILQTSVLALNNDVAANESDVERQNQRKEVSCSVMTKRRVHTYGR